MSKWEQGKNFPELTTIQPLSIALDITPAELLGFEETSSDAVLSVSMKLYEEERTHWLKELRNRAWTTLVFNFAIIPLSLQIIANSRYSEECLLFQAF